MTKKYNARAGASSPHPIEQLAQHLLAGASDTGSLTTQQGTAKRSGGQQTARRILGAALQLLLTPEHMSFSLRAVASAAGVKLANVQYYYPSKDALLKSVCDAIYESYEAGYGASAAQGETTEQTLERVLRYQIDDIQQPRTRRFFMRLWLLLEESNDFSGALLGDLYRLDIQSLQQLIQKANAPLGVHEANTRATLVAAMIEGSMVVSPASPLSDDLKESLASACLTIALAPPSSVPGG